ncbi:MAG: bacillithiol system redox-active protein YtxJ [Acidobacteria bacterium]|nr:MAG: bacillithiol system redox-active protein YtxJ [Acidobacteriota bacterium]
MNWEARDRELLAEVDRELEDRNRLAGTHLVCRIGCTECCIGPFAINRLDVLRLQRGLSLLQRKAPDRALAIVDRARAQLAQFGPAYPGDPLSGALSQDDRSVEAFFEQFSHVACPVLDPVSGRCELYSARPLSCRTFGLPVHLGGEDLDPCRLCFTAATAGEIDACRACLDPQGREQQLLVQLERGEYNEETIIAFAVGAGSDEPMREITSEQDLEKVFDEPLAVVFKHSTRCPISRTAQREVELFLNKRPDIPVYLVDVIRDRLISRALATRTGVRHESPQTIVLRRGAVAWHGSHYQVTADAIRHNMPQGTV